MQRTIALSCVLLVLALSSCAPVAHERAAERQQQITAIGYGNIDFSVPHSRFLEMFRGAMKVQNEDESLGVSHYAIQGTDNGIDVVGFVFFNDQLLNLLFTYQEDRIAQLGGVDALKADAIERFGTPTEENEIGVVWSFPASDRKIVAVFQEGMWTVSIERTSVAMQLQTIKTQVADVQNEESNQSSETAKPKEGWVYWQPTAAERAEMEAEVRAYSIRHQRSNGSGSRASEHWFQGGSLHNATVSEWKQATYSNKLATAADWLGATTWKGHLTSRDAFDRLKDKARKLVQAVDGATIDISPSDLGGVVTAREVAATIILMSNDLGPY